MQPRPPSDDAASAVALVSLSGPLWDSFSGSALREEDHRVDDATAPDVLGLHPDDAARVCLAQDLELSVENAGDMMWWGWDQPGAQVAEQWPAPSSRMSSKTLVVRVGFIGGTRGAGVPAVRGSR